MSDIVPIFRAIQWAGDPDAMWSPDNLVEPAKWIAFDSNFGECRVDT
jgi:hypothetical protein